MNLEEKSDNSSELENPTRRLFFKLGLATAATYFISKILGGVISAITQEVTPTPQFNLDNTESFLDFQTRVPLNWDYDRKKEFYESTLVKINVNQEKEEIFLGVYTQDWDRKDWSKSELKNVPCNKRYTHIYQPFCFTRLFLPKGVSIENIEHRAHIVFNEKMMWTDDLKPLEDHPVAKQLEGNVKEFANWIMQRIPLGNKAKEYFAHYIQQSEKIRNETAKKMAEDIGKDYYSKIIFPLIPKKMGYTETAREEKIKLKIDNKDKPQIVYVEKNIFLGDPTQNFSDGWANKSGNLYIPPKRVILRGKNIKNQKESDYFLKGKELENLIALEGNKYSEDQRELVTEKQIIISQMELKIQKKDPTSYSG